MTEPVLFGVRGKLRTLAPGRRQVNVIATQKREHSRKPDELYPVIEACSPGPFLELFARYPRPDWMVWGHEAAEDVVPRGRQYPAYGAGSLDGRRVEGPLAHARGEEAAFDVQSGAACTGWPPLTTRRRS